jgi:hypothetical protein
MQYAPPATVKKPKKPIYKRVWFWLVVVFVLVFAIDSALSNYGASEPAGYFKADGSLKSDVAVDFQFISEKAVRQYLAAPSTADFESLHNKYYTFDDDDIFAISGTVTAQNSFGVPLDAEFFVKFRYSGNYKDYEILVVVIDDKVYFDEDA